MASVGERPPVQLVPAESLRPHEQVVPAKVEELARFLDREGVVRLAVVADEATRVVLDGHHRLAALKRLGCRLVPAILIDYLRPDVRVGTWRDGEEPPRKDEVVRHALDGKLYPPKTTRHFFPWRLREEPVRLDDLRR